MLLLLLLAVVVVASVLLVGLRVMGLLATLVSLHATELGDNNTSVLLVNLVVNVLFLEHLNDGRLELSLVALRVNSLTSNTERC